MRLRGVGALGAVGLNPLRSPVSARWEGFLPPRGAAHVSPWSWRWCVGGLGPHPAASFHVGALGRLASHPVGEYYFSTQGSRGWGVITLKGCIKAKANSDPGDFGWDLGLAAPSRPSGSQAPTFSAPRGHLPGLRQGAPGRAPGGRGRLPDLSSVAEREEALRTLETEVYAESSRKTLDMKMRTVRSALSKWGVPLLPPSMAAIKALRATLKKGGYRSAESYLVLYKNTCERQGLPYSADLLRAHRDCVRSCLRGLGGPTKAMALPFDRLGALDLEDDGPWASYGPVGPGCAVLAGAWFLMREIELSTTRAALLSFKGSVEDELAVTWSLPASKTDQQAVGALRTHGCACGSPRKAGCVYHALRRQVERLQRLFPQRFTDGEADMDLPLFPDVEGNVVTKDAMTNTIVEAAAKLGVETVTKDKGARISGHSLRMTGAQGFARWGIEVWAIQLLRRWGSSAVLEYVQDVPLELSAGWARRGGGTSTSSSSLFSSPRVAVGSPLPLSSSIALEKLAKDQPPEKKPLDTAGCKVVVSPGRVWHRLPGHGTEGPMSGWSTVCGWKFSGSDGTVKDVLPSPLLHKWMCKKCFPTERREAKAAL